MRLARAGQLSVEDSVMRNEWYDDPYGTVYLDYYVVTRALSQPEADVRVEDDTVYVWHCGIGLRIA